VIKLLAKVDWVSTMSSTSSRRIFLQRAAAVSALSIVPVGFAEAGRMATKSTQGLRFGVNYVPRKNWWYCWLDWDQQAVVEDLHAIAGLGMDHIRIQCLWPFFQPGISNVSERALANLHALLDAADGAGLDVEVTVLNGWMSGLSFLPAWVAPLLKPGDTSQGNIFTSTEVIRAEKFLLRRMAETIGKHRRFLGFDLGNELGVLMRAGNNPTTTGAADAWAKEMLRYCEEIAPEKLNVLGVDHSHWYNDFGFSRGVLANTGSATVVHSYIYFDGVLERYRYDDAASAHLAAYAVELAYAYQDDLKRPVWVEEIGVSRKECPLAYQPTYMENAVRNIAATGKAWGITWWGSHDIDRADKSFGDYEYELGLIDQRNQPKALGLKFAELAASLRRSPQPVERRSAALVIPEFGLSQLSWPPDWRFAGAYMKLIERGIVPAIVLETRAKDEAYLRERGIMNLVRLQA
jgi:endo-1,4-beta-mannosidase